jgi:hypothetical protein
MLPRVRTILLFGLPLLFISGVDAAAQAGRLVGTVAYATPIRPTPARGVRVVAVDDNRQAWETRTDSNGNFGMLLRAGRYRILAEGAQGYITYGEVWGYVRANSNSIIIPNPLFLVPPSRSSDSMMSPALSQTATGRESKPTVQQNNFTLEMAAHESGPGTLSGKVMYKDKNRNREAIGVTVVATDNNRQTWPTTTNNKGDFVLSLWEGTYTIVVQGAPGYFHEQPVWGYVRANTPSVITPNPIYLMPLPPPRRHSGR